MTLNRDLAVGTLFMAAASLIGLVVSGVGFLNPTSGIAGTAGALLVLLSSAALVIAAVALPVLRRAIPWLHTFLVILCVLGLIGTGIAAYFLELPVLIATMLAAALGLVLYLMAPARSMETSR